VPANVIAISRATGAGAEEIAEAVAQELGFRVVDEEIVSRAAEKHGFDEDIVKEAERRRPLILRLLDEVATSHVSFGMTAPAPADDSGNVLRSETVRSVIRDAIAEAAAQGDVVIVAHAASLALADVDGILRVLVTASPETRARRLAAAGGLKPDDAAREIRASDRARADYFKRFYSLDAELPTHYDLVLNTDRLKPEQAAALVAAAARAA
jgi:cytidylate kinase